MNFRAILPLWLLAAIPFALAFLVTRERLRRSIARRFASERLRGAASSARALRPWLLGLALALGLVALAGPFAGYTLVPVVAREANRVLVLDVSHSMAAEDVGTSRLFASKAIAMRLAEAQEGRVALIVFEGAPEVVSPLTSDAAAVVSLIDSVVPGEVGEPGSDLGNAILAALRLIESDPGVKADMVVISDGEDQGARVRDAVQRAKARGVEISTIVVGSSAGSTIPTERGPLRDENNEVVTTYARTEVMSEVANATGGMMFENPFGANALHRLLGSGGATTRRETHARVPVDRYQWPLAFAFVALIGASLLHRGAE
ncbi:MAG TPA: VWA domain-containing protein [Thermoanaerobaculia bacterium]|nr:VWA domain-containing protein [Thermoanaerobaculia bacterium]